MTDDNQTPDSQNFTDSELAVSESNDMSENTQISKK